MITIDQLLESVNLDFKPRWVTKDKNGLVVIWSAKPKILMATSSWEKNDFCEVACYKCLKLAEFEGKNWTECIYEVPRKTTGKIEKLDIIKDTRNVIDKDGIVHMVANFTTVEKINELVDAVNELKGAKNE